MIVLVLVLVLILVLVLLPVSHGASPGFAGVMVPRLGLLGSWCPAWGCWGHGASPGFAGVMVPRLGSPE